MHTDYLSSLLCAVSFQNVDDHGSPQLLLFGSSWQSSTFCYAFHYMFFLAVACLISIECLQYTLQISDSPIPFSSFSARGILTLSNLKYEYPFFFLKRSSFLSMVFSLFPYKFEAKEMKTSLPL